MYSAMYMYMFSPMFVHSKIFVKTANASALSRIKKACLSNQKFFSIRKLFYSTENPILVHDGYAGRQLRSAVNA